MAKRGVASLNLIGFEEVRATFDVLPEKLKKKALRPALRSGAKVIQKDAKARAPKGKYSTGRNKKYIKIKSLKRSRKSFGVKVQTGTRQELGIPRDAKGYYPFSLEYGTKKTPARPYMRPALSTNRKKATMEVGRKLKTKIDDIVRKQPKVK
jgi:HK97 gp10 family phage protein